MKKANTQHSFNLICCIFKAFSYISSLRKLTEYKFLIKWVKWEAWIILKLNTAQKWLWILLHSPKKSLSENFILCSMWCQSMLRICVPFDKEKYWCNPHHKTTYFTHIELKSKVSFKTHFHQILFLTKNTLKCFEVLPTKPWKRNLTFKISIPLLYAKNIVSIRYEYPLLSILSDHIELVRSTSRIVRPTNVANAGFM